MGKKILIAEDEAELLFTVKSRLEFEGFAVTTVGDGEEALKKVQEDRPDLILLDIMMPKLNGYQVCRELKSNPETKEIPVALVTAKTQETDKFWGKDVGANDYITKPFDMDALLEKIRGILEP